MVNHKDANKENNNAENLEWCTQKHNVNQSYITSGMDAKRNYKIYNLIDKEGNKSIDLYGGTEVNDYIIKNNIPIYTSMILKHRQNKGYTLMSRNKEDD